MVAHIHHVPAHAPVRVPVPAAEEPAAARRISLRPISNLSILKKKNRIQRKNRIQNPYKKTDL